MRLPDTEPTRKQRFSAALKLAGMTLEYWRSEVYVVSGQHINQVLNGEREGSRQLNAAINDLIAKYLPDVAA